MKIISIIFMLTISLNVVFAQQAHFITSGSIVYEKTVNMYALIKRGQVSGKNVIGQEQQLLDAYQAKHSQFKTYKSTLTFADGKTLFTPEAIQSESLGGMRFLPAAGQLNIVYADQVGHQTVSQKNVFDELFLLKDSTRSIRWKITDETREVAGYTCRRANALVLDSIYVVAFYTEAIHIPGGPESFGGLPGMILEVALPHENINWHAVSVTEAVITPPVPPYKGKLVHRQQLLDAINKGVNGSQTPQQADMQKKNYLL